MKKQSNMKKQSFSEEVSGAWGQLAHKDKVLMLTQSVLSLLILIILGLGSFGLVRLVVTLRIDLVLVIALLLVSALRSYPEKKGSLVLYIVCMLIAVFCLVMNCIQ